MLPKVVVLVQAFAQVFLEAAVERLVRVVHRLCGHVLERRRVDNAGVAELVDEERVIFRPVDEVDELVGKLGVRRVLKDYHAVKGGRAADFGNEEVYDFVPAAFVNFAVNDFGVALAKPKVSVGEPLSKGFRVKFHKVGLPFVVHTVKGSL